jgi:hypothetical protein
VTRSRSSQLQIIATTEEGTRAAMLQAKQQSANLATDRIVVIVPRTLPGIQHDDASTVQRYRRMAAECGLDVVVRLCLLGGRHHALQQIIPKNSVAIVGGSKRWWWPTDEQRIATALGRAGHEVIFASE